MASFDPLGKLMPTAGDLIVHSRRVDRLFDVLPKAGEFPAVLAAAAKCREASDQHQLNERCKDYWWELAQALYVLLPDRVKNAL